MGLLKRRIPGWLQGSIYGAIRAAITAIGAAPPVEAGRYARSAGRLFGSAPFNRKRLQRAIDNLSVARPTWGLDQRREYALRAYEHVFMLAVEMTLAERVISRDGWPARIAVGHLGEALRRLVAGGPVIMVTGHCGNWELLGYTMAQLGFPLNALYRPLDLKPLDAWVRRTREAHGLRLIDKFGAGDDLPLVLSGGGIPSFVADQNAGDRGLFVPFFGRLASSYKSIGLLALSGESTIVCGSARRVGVDYDDTGFAPGGAPEPVRREAGNEPALRYRMEVVDTISPADWAGQPDPLFYITARYRRAIERMVELCPEQFLWMHRYWKSRPRHERLGREFPAALRAKLEALPWMTSEELERIMEHSRRDAAGCLAGEKF